MHAQLISNVVIALATTFLGPPFCAASVNCLVTNPNQKGPHSSANSFGNGKLSTTLSPKGEIVFLPSGPGMIREDGSLIMKFWWHRAIPGELTIEGRRLDAPGPPLRANIPKGYGPTGFQASELIFPTTGCWQITGRAGDSTLTFTTSVVNKSKANR